MYRITKKGFTLIELMIVLAIIAILAVVLVPKAGILKKQSKTQGIQTNLNAIRVYIEPQLLSGTPDNDRSNINIYMTANYINTNSIVNPLTGNKGIGTSSVGTTSSGAGNSVMVFAWNGSVNNGSYQNSFPWFNSTMNGCVVLVVCNDGYFLYGVDNSGAQIDFSIVK